MTLVADNSPLLQVQGLCKSYPGANSGESVEVLSEISLTLNSGDTAAVVGPSGCGKTTLLNILGTLDTPNAGSVRFLGAEIADSSESQRASIRAQWIGFVFQEHHLLPQCSAIENVLIPTLAKGVNNSGARERAAELLERVGLADRINHRPDALSGGQRQRVAIVRALINRPALLLVDEPTGALDADTADQIMALLIELNSAERTAMVMVTHAQDLAARLQRTLRLERGRLVEDTAHPAAGGAA